MKTYKISELGKIFGLSRSTLLYYDHIGLLQPCGRTGSDYRAYTENDRIRLERICFFRETGLGLSEIARLLENGEQNSILENRLREINDEIANLKSQQRIITGVLKTVADGIKTSGLDADMWISLQKACGLDGTGLRRWHAEFERRAPETHHNFLLGLGLSEKEAIQVRMLTKNVEDNTMRMKYFYELFEDLPRQGPGCREATLKALNMLKDLPERPAVLDIGCGCGMQTLLLADKLRTKIIAIDNHRPVLEHLKHSAETKGLDIETRELSMIDMPFDRASFDLLWCEGAIFIIGLLRGLRDFYDYLKVNGYLAFTEMCWFENEPPAEIRKYFDGIYADMHSPEEVCRLAVSAGYQVIDHFNLPDSAWRDDYYTPMLERMKDLKIKNAGIPEAEAVYAEAELEAEMFRRYSKSYGYTFFILQKK